MKHCPDAVFAQNTGLLRSQDKRSTQKANYGILINWMNNQDSQEDAYVLMKDALERAGLKLIIRDVLYCGLLSDTIPTSTPTYQLLCPALTDDHLLELSLRLSGDTMIHLAIELGISSHEVRKTFEKYCSDESPTQKANIELLKTWLKKQKSCKDAYVLMGEGLIQVGLNIIAKEVLDYHLQKSGIALTDDLLKQLSWKLTKQDMKNLAKELGFSTQEIHKTFETFVKHCLDAVFAQNTGPLRSQDKRSTQKANYGILINWMNNQDSQEDAYVLMKDALERAGLNSSSGMFCTVVSSLTPSPLQLQHTSSSVQH